MTNHFHGYFCCFVAPVIPHRIGDNRERRVLNNVMFSIARSTLSIAKFDIMAIENVLFEFVDFRFGNRKRFIWQSLTFFSENERLFAIAAYPVCEYAEDSFIVRTRTAYQYRIAK